MIEWKASLSCWLHAWCVILLFLLLGTSSAHAAGIPTDPIVSYELQVWKFGKTNPDIGTGFVIRDWNRPQALLLVTALHVINHAKMIKVVSIRCEDGKRKGNILWTIQKDAKNPEVEVRIWAASDIASISIPDEFRDAFEGGAGEVSRQPLSKPPPATQGTELLMLGTAKNKPCAHGSGEFMFLVTADNYGKELLGSLAPDQLILQYTSTANLGSSGGPVVVKTKARDVIAVHQASFENYSYAVTFEKLSNKPSIAIVGSPGNWPEQYASTAYEAFRGDKVAEKFGICPPDKSSTNLDRCNNHYCPDEMVMVPAVHSGVEKCWCVDRYEASRGPGGKPSSAQGKRPWIVGRQQDAVDACESVGKNLCPSDVWTTACRGLGDSVYPYGKEYQAENCVGEKKQVSFSDTGSKENCKPAYDKIYDMSGNVVEWTATGNRIMGGGWTSTVEDLTCVSCLDANTTSIVDIGFRCCKPAEQPVPWLKIAKWSGIAATTASAFLWLQAYDDYERSEAKYTGARTEEEVEELSELGSKRTQLAWVTGGVGALTVALWYIDFIKNEQGSSLDARSSSLTIGAGFDGEQIDVALMVGF